MNGSILGVSWTLGCGEERHLTEIRVCVRGSAGKDQTNVAMEIEVVRLGAKEPNRVDNTTMIRDTMLHSNN